tara:strand:- start:1545 stop:2372 length:828 start_codon:yes stop_codon:yes gene_type:complete
MRVFMFPGQGSQFKGMGESLFQKFPRECEHASNLLGYDIVDLCLQDPRNQLNQTYYTQPAIYFVSVLSFLNEDTKPDCLLGHSLGLYGALFAAQAFSLEEGLQIVQKRSSLMSEANNGSMMAVIGSGLNQLEEILINLEFHDIDIANYNADNQIVLSGKTARITELQPILNKQGFRAIILPVSGAFHSRQMKPALVSFFDFLVGKTFNDLKLPVISTITGQPLSNSHLIEEMTYQLIKPVRWRQVVSYLKKNAGHIEFKEVGPGTVLQALHRQIT